MSEPPMNFDDAKVACKGILMQDRNVRSNTVRKVAIENISHFHVVGSKPPPVVEWLGVEHIWKAVKV